MTEQSSAHLVTPVFDNSDVVYTICRKGEADLAEEFIRTLDERDQAKFNRYLERLRDGHQVKSPENMRRIHFDDPKGTGAVLHELKSARGGGLRLYLIHYRGRWYLTHGTKKVPDKRVPQEARKAFKIFHGE